MSTRAPRRSRKPVEYPKEESVDKPTEGLSSGMSAEYVGLTDTPEGRAAVGLEPTATTEAPQVPALRSAMPTDAAGTYALANMGDEEFSVRLATLKRGRDRIAQIQRELMEQDVDYGLIPGTPKPTLFKPGAEKLAQIYGLAARVETKFIPGDGDIAPPLQYSAAAFLHLGSFDGPIVAVGHGVANSWEKRYRRDAAKVCPNCGKPAIIKSKAEYGGGWFCFPKKGGCGQKFRDGDDAIESQGTDAKGDSVGAWDLDVTLLKMAEKRAFVDAVLRATASSSLFTQDVAEEPVVDNTEQPAAGAERRVDTSAEYPAELEEAEPEVRTADLGEVQRGGHRPTVTGAQIEAARTLARSMKLTPWQVADEIAETLGGGIDSTQLDDDKATAGGQLLSFMQSMDPDDMGKVISHLRKKSEDKE